MGRIEGIELRATLAAIVRAISRARPLLVVLLLAPAIAAPVRAAVVETVLPVSTVLRVGDTFQVEVRVTDNTRPIGAFAMLLLFTPGSLERIGPAESDPFTFVESSPLTSGSMTQVLLGGAAKDFGNGAPPDATVFRTTFKVLALSCNSAIEIKASPGADVLTDIETLGPIPATFDSSASDRLLAHMVTGDLDGDGQTTGADSGILLDLLLARNLPTAQSIQGDLNGDCALDVSDFVLLLSRI